MMKPYKYGLFHAILLTAILIRPINVFSQQKNIGSQSLVLAPGSIRLDSLSDRVARQSGIVFTFNTLKIEPGKRITLLTATVKLDALLSYLHQSYQLANHVIGNHIILSPDDSGIKRTANAVKKKEHAPVLDKKSASEKIPTGGAFHTGRSKSTAAVPLAVIDYRVHMHCDRLTAPIEVRKTRLAEDRASQSMVLEPIASSDKGPGEPPSALLEDAVKNRTVHGLNGGKSPQTLFASLGVTTDDVLYTGTQIRAGLPWLFVTGALNSNFRTLGFFYGLGSSVKLSDHWGAQLSVQRGLVSREFALATDTFPAINTLRAESHLTRIGLKIEKYFGSRWTFQFGPVFNFMKSRYSIKERSIGSSGPTSPGVGVNGKYKVLKPVYTLSQTYNEANRRDKATWIGIQMGLFYRLF